MHSIHARAHYTHFFIRVEHKKETLLLVEFQYLRGFYGCYCELFARSRKAYVEFFEG